MNNMTKHPTEVSTTVPSYALGKELAGLRYDLLAEVLYGLRDQLYTDSATDGQAGRPKLSDALKEVASSVELTSIAMSKVCGICHRHIQQERNG